MIRVKCVVMKALQLHCIVNALICIFHNTYISQNRQQSLMIFIIPGKIVFCVPTSLNPYASYCKTKPANCEL